ncbi:aquaporin-8-like [Haliotis asinina]|uniref:aquaporin-8-like n=1 Tax=Haliotis asinina TaxID=109174 RepID=UPI0035327A8A
MACLGDPESDKMAEEREAFWRVFEAIMQACAAEFLGTAIYVLIACLVSSGVKGIGILPPEHMPMIVPIALCAGFTVAALMATFGKMSGGHFNPAVSVAVCVSGSLKPLLLPAYILMQMVGGVAGAALAMVVEPDELFTKVLTDDYVEMAVGPGRAIACEFLLTAFVVIAVLLTTLEEKTKTHAAPTAVGFAYVVGILSGIRITGTSLNPARSFGSAVVLCLYSNKAWSHQYVFWVGPLLAAVVIAIFYRYVLFRRKTSSKEIYKYSHLMTDPNQND